MRSFGRACASSFLPEFLPGVLVAATIAGAFGPSAAMAASASSYFSVTPCRVLDTRLPDGPLGGPSMAADQVRLFTIAGKCGVPLTASAVSANIVVTGAAASGLLRVFPGDVAEPDTNSISFSVLQTRAGNGLFLLASDNSGALAFHNLSPGAIDVVFDVTGFFDVTCSTIVVNPTSLASVPDGTPVNTTLTASGGNGPYSFTVTAGALPGGVNLDPAGLLSGTPTAGGSFSFTATATDFNGCTGSRAYTLLVVCPTITVSPSTIPPGAVGVPYGPVNFTQAGAVGGVTWSFTGALPAGVSLGAAGVLSGTPTQAGTFPITVKATDPGGCSGTVDVTLSTCPPITVTNPATTTGIVDAAFSQTFTQSGAQGAATFTTASPLPAGLALSAAGVLSGSPTAPGTFPIVVTVTDANGCTGTGATYTLVIGCQGITVTNPVVTAGIFNTAFSQAFTQTGAHGTATFTTNSTLPTGLSLSAGGVLAGTPLQTGSFPIAVTVTDANGCTGTSSTYTLAIGPKLTAKAYTDVGNTQLAGGVVAPATPSVGVAGVSSGDSSDTTITYAATVAPTHGTLTAFNTNGTFLYTPNTGNTTADSFTYTGTSNGVSSTQSATIAFDGMVWWVDSATASGTNDGRSNTPFKTMTAVNGAATNNGDFIYVFKGSGTTTGAYAMKPGQRLIGAGATLNVPTIAPLVTIAGADGNTPTIGATVTLASNVTVAGFDMNTDASNGIAGTSVSGITVALRNVATTTGTGVTIGGSGNSGTLQFRSIASNGAVNGISLTNTSGSFTVTGDGASDPADTTRGRTTAKLGGGALTLGSGGTISATTGPAVILSNTANVTLRNMTLSTAAGAVDDGRDGINVSNSSNLVLDNLLIAGIANNSGLMGSALAGLTLQHCTIGNNATNDTVSNVWNIEIDNLTGAATFSNSAFDTTHYQMLGIVETGASALNMTVTNCLFQNVDDPPNAGNDLLGISANDTSNVSLSVDDSTFKHVYNNGIRYVGNDSSGGGLVDVRNSTFDDDGTSINIVHQGMGKRVQANIKNNHIRDSGIAPGPPGNALNAVNVGMGTQTDASSVLEGYVTGNTIGNPALAFSGSLQGNAIRAHAFGSGTMTLWVSGNSIRQIKQDDAFDVVTSKQSPSTGVATVNLTATANDFRTDTAGTGLAAFALGAGSGAFSGDSPTVCANVLGNTIFSGDTTFSGVHVSMLGTSPTVQLVGYGGATNDDAAVTSFLGSAAVASTNTPTPALFTRAAGTVQSVASCPVPSFPQP